jgi:zinc transport system substrate-binding protein
VRLIIIIIAFVAVLPCGCGDSSSAKKGGRTNVVAALYPLAFAAQEIGGERVEVVNLTPAGAEPHSLELSPNDLERIRSADLVLLLGHGFQPQPEKAAGEGDSVLKLLDSPGVELFDNDDPHVWLDPLRFALVVERIGKALGEKPAAQRLIARLKVLDAEYRRGLARCERREIITSHEAFGYLADRYGLEQVGVTGLSPEAEPTPRDLERVVSLVRRSGATTVFSETLVSPRIAQTVAREAGARTAVLNPIEGLTAREEQEGEDYFSLMRANLRELRAALTCR